MATTAPAPPPSKQPVSEPDFTAAVADKLSRTLNASHVSHPTRPCPVTLTTQRSNDRTTYRCRNVTISLTVPRAQPACGGCFSQPVRDEFAVALGILRVVLFAMFVVLIFVLFWWLLVYVLS